MSNKIFRFIFSLCLLAFSFAGVLAQDTLSVAGSAVDRDTTGNGFFEAYKKYFTKLVNDNE